MTDREAVLQAIGAIVARIVGPKRALPSDMNDATPLAEGGLWLDSVELLEVVVACEAEFEITFEAAVDLVGNALDTLGTLADLIQTKRPRLTGARPAAPGA